HSREDDPFYEPSIEFDLGPTDGHTLDRLQYGRRGNRTRLRGHEFPRGRFNQKDRDHRPAASFLKNQERPRSEVFRLVLKATACSTRPLPQSGSSRVGMTSRPRREARFSIRPPSSECLVEPPV